MFLLALPPPPLSPLFPSKYQGKMRAHGATRDEREETRKETERKSENINARTVRCACCRNETVERVAGSRTRGRGRKGTREVARRRGMGNCNEQLDSYK